MVNRMCLPNDSPCEFEPETNSSGEEDCDEESVCLMAMISLSIYYHLCSIRLLQHMKFLDLVQI